MRTLIAVSLAFSATHLIGNSKQALGVLLICAAIEVLRINYE